MRRVVTGEQVAQIYNPDPFARPGVPRPGLPDPGRAHPDRLAGPADRPAAAAGLPAPGAPPWSAAVLAFLWVSIGWIGVTLLAGWAVLVLVIWWHYWPVTFGRWVATPARSKWRAWGYRRKWAAVTSIADLAPLYRGRIILPVLVKVTSTRYVDRVHVRLVSGQCAADFADRADNLAHGFGALLCRVRTARSGAVVLEFVRRDALAAVVPALPVPARPDLQGAAGRPPRGRPALAGPAARHPPADRRSHRSGQGLAAVGPGPGHAAADARGPGPGAGRRSQADGTGLRPDHLRHLRRTTPPTRPPSPTCSTRRSPTCRPGPPTFAGRQRDHTPTREHPFTVVLVDEVAFLTAYQPDRKLKERIMLALATLTTQGRALGYAVVAALQDPRKDVLTIRNLFPDRIAMRLDEPEQVDMVLGDGARDRGAACELISTDPATGAGVAFIRLEADPDPVRVRAGWVTDTDIRDMAAGCLDDTRPAGDRGGGGMTILTLWQTDDPCPSCGTTLTLAEDGSPVQRAECRTLRPGRHLDQRPAGRR